MSKLISTKIWDNYKKVINNASETFNQVVVVWKRSLGGIDRFGEDNATERFENINLNALAEYNKNRVWPSTSYTEAGELDHQSEIILLNIDYLRGLGYINNNNNFIFDPAHDRVIHRGITYKCGGITPLSQASDQDLLYQVILVRDTMQSQKPII